MDRYSIAFNKLIDVRKNPITQEDAKELEDRIRQISSDYEFTKRELGLAQDKLSRRNMQIKDLKEKIAGYSEAVLEIMRNLNADPVHPTARIIEKEHLDKLVDADNR